MAAGDAGALYAAASGVVIALIGGGVALLNGRYRPPDDDDQLAQMHRLLMQAHAETDLWRHRAYDAGWTE